MIFEKQQYQQDCINNIISLLSTFDFKSHSVANLQDCLKNFYQNTKNQSETPISDNKQTRTQTSNDYTRDKQTKSEIAIQTISKNLNIDIVMETGTGKTFTYLNLIFELHKIYKQNKFIIFVPRKAILESVRQNIELTKSYFYSEYKTYLKAYYYTDSNSQSSIISHYIKNQDELSVLILTNSAIDKKDNILNKPNEGLFNTKSIFENIIDLKPIAIIDEPHLLKGDKFSQSFKKLNSLYFRFGATFPKDKDYELSNVAYCLDSILAFREYLVKQIRVHTLIQQNENLRLLSTNTKNKIAKFSYFLSGIEKTAILKVGESLGSIDSTLHHITLENLAKNKAYLSDKRILESKNGYTLSNEEISNLLAKAISLHFEKEQILFSQNIKALSLFFIPNIADFRESKELDSKIPFIKQEFERLYKQKRQEILKQNISQEYRAFLQKDFDESGNLKVHQGYFSGDSHSKAKTQDDKLAADIALILKDKEKLLSFDTPLRFIFSVWALQEGWDNPNIFTLVKLANSSTDTSRHQQVGRGLRLCVNAEGRRITHSFLHEDSNQFYDINYLDIVVSSEERQFIEGLQQEIKDSSFEVEFISSEILKNLGLNDRQTAKIINYLEDNNAIQYNEIGDNYAKLPNFQSIIESQKAQEILGDKFTSFIAKFKEPQNKREQVIDANKKQESIQIRQNLAREFKELWETIHKNAQITYKNINQESLLETIAKHFNKESIAKEPIYFEKSQLDFSNNTITKEKVEFATKDYAKSIDKTIKSNLLDFAKDNNIPLYFVLELFNKLDYAKFCNSPKSAFELLKRIYKESIHSHLVSAVSYEFSEYIFSNDDLLYDRFGNPRENIKKVKFGAKYELDKEPSKHYLFSKILYDSELEKEVILENISLKDVSIQVFAKLPKFRIQTSPTQSYEPDFAYLIKLNGSDEKIFFICETKGYDSISDISQVEQEKINYAKKFFEALQDNLKQNNDSKHIRIIYTTRLNKQELFTILQDFARDNQKINKE